MSIDYGPFLFAAPLCCGAEWLDHAMWLAGANGPRVRGNSYDLFPDGTPKLKISTVCHPCLWMELSHLTCALEEKMPDPIKEAQLGLETFMAKYFRGHRGGVSRMFACYGADVVSRLEDQPAALVELLKSLGIKGDGLRQLCGPVLPPRLEWKPEVRAAFLAAEKEMCERYDYF